MKRQTSTTDRLSHARELAASRSCTHLFVNDPVDVEYLSGFHSSNAFLLISAAKNVLFTDFRYEEAVKKHCAGHPERRFVLIKDSVFPYLAARVPADGIVGFQSDGMSVHDADQMKKALVRGARRKPVPLARVVTDLSIVKTPAEVRAMAAAAAVGDAALRRFCRHVKPGITEKEAAARLDRLCSTLGSEKPSFDTIVLFGKNSALPHGRPGEKRLAKGDFVLIDFGCTVDGFCSDMTRTFVCKKASVRQKRLYALVRKAQEEARTAARAGIAARSLDAVARDMIKKAGFGGAFGHGLGHGVGRRIHERPRLSSTSTCQLEAGSVVTIEPGVYLPGFGGVRIEDMILLNNNGSELLTHFPRELIEI